MNRNTANANTTSPNIIDVFVTNPIDLCFHWIHHHNEECCHHNSSW